VLPFQTIAIDFIVKLPTSEGYDSIMTVTDHDCTKAVVLVPCQETINAEGVAKLFKDQIFPFVGLPHQKKSTFLTTSYYILLHLIPLILGVRKE